MRMTLYTDYALRMLVYMATRREGNCKVSDVATAYGLSQNHLLKVAHGLRRCGFIETTRGRMGGIRLARTPESINLGTLVRLTEEDFALVECMQGDGCAISPACRLKGIVGEALDAYLAVFDKYTLADIIVNGRALASLLDIDLRAA